MERPTIVRRPSLACLGKVASVGEVTVSESGDYRMVMLTVDALPQSGQNSSLRLMFPTKVDILDPGFAPKDWAPDYAIPKTRAEADERGMDVSDEDIANNNVRRGVYFMFGKHILSAEGTSPAFIEGLTGADFDAFAQALEDYYKDDANEKPISDIALRELLRDYLLNVEFGYILKQGKRDGVFTDRMELDEIFAVDDESIAAVLKRADRSKNRLLVAFPS